MNSKQYRAVILLSSIPISILYLLTYDFEGSTLVLLVVSTVIFVILGELLLYTSIVFPVIYVAILKPSHLNLLKYRWKLVFDCAFKLKIDQDLLSYIHIANTPEYKEELDEMEKYIQKGIPYKHYSSVKSAEDVEMMLFMIKTYNDNGPSWERRRKLLDYAQKHNFVSVEASYPETESNSSPTFSKETEAILDKYL